MVDVRDDIIVILPEVDLGISVHGNIYLFKAITFGSSRTFSDVVFVADGF